MNNKLQLVGYWKLQGTLECVTGLRIGSAAETIEIGGLDNPIIRHPISKLPYVPGSSLKGKMRSLLEMKLDKIDPRPNQIDGRTGRVLTDKKGKPLRNREYGEVHKPKGAKGWNCEGRQCPICRLFGSSAGTSEIGPSRLIVRDAELTLDMVNEAGETVKGWKTRLEELKHQGETDSEIKHENTINRITAEANPRQMERVPAGVEFTFEIGYRIFDDGDGGATDRRLFQHVIDSLKLVEADALGGSGSRGYGRVVFKNLLLTDLGGVKLAPRAKDLASLVLPAQDEPAPAQAEGEPGETVQDTAAP